MYSIWHSFNHMDNFTDSSTGLFIYHVSHGNFSGKQIERVQLNECNLMKLAFFFQGQRNRNSHEWNDCRKWNQRYIANWRKASANFFFAPTTSSQFLAKFIHFYINFLDVPNRQLELISLQFLHQKPQFSACGFFSIDMTFVYAVTWIL